MVSGIIFLNDEVAAEETKPKFGVEEPTPTFPLERILKSDDVANPADVVDATSKSGVEEP